MNIDVHDLVKIRVERPGLIAFAQVTNFAVEVEQGDRVYIGRPYGVIGASVCAGKPGSKKCKS